MINVEKQLIDIENTLKAAKSVQSVSGSMVEFHIIESDEYSASSTESSTGISFKFTFHPLDNNVQSDLTELTVVQDGGTFTPSGGTPVRLSSWEGGHDNGKRDADGNLYVVLSIYAPSSIGKWVVTVHAVATGPVDGYFTCETTV